MLNGEEFGAAVAAAIQMKIDSGAVRSKAEIARHFGVRAPSVEDWIKKGAIKKERLPELWRYFSDVAGPEHWGLTESEWPIGLSTRVNNLRVEIAGAADPNAFQHVTDDEQALLKAFRSLGPTERRYLLEDAKKYQTKREKNR